MRIVTVTRGNTNGSTIVCTLPVYSFIQVLRFGELVEFDEPHTLLSNPRSYFLRLVEHTGPGAAAKLKDIAYEAYVRCRTKDNNGVEKL